MFHDLKEAYTDLLKSASHIVDTDGVHISFPEKAFARFEQEYNLCFVEPEDDHLFKSWQENHEDENERQRNVRQQVLQISKRYTEKDEEPQCESEQRV